MSPYRIIGPELPWYPLEETDNIRLIAERLVANVNGTEKKMGLAVPVPIGCGTCLAPFSMEVEIITFKETKYRRRVFKCHPHGRVTTPESLRIQFAPYFLTSQEIATMLELFSQAEPAFPDEQTPAPANDKSLPELLVSSPLISVSQLLTDLRNARGVEEKRKLEASLENASKRTPTASAPTANVLPFAPKTETTAFDQAIDKLKQEYHKLLAKQTDATQLHARIETKEKELEKQKSINDDLRGLLERAKFQCEVKKKEASEGLEKIESLTKELSAAKEEIEKLSAITASISALMQGVPSSSGVKPNKLEPHW